MASSVSELHKAGPDDIRFGEFHLAMSEARLFRGKTLVPLSPKGLDVLHFLAARAGRLVTKDELLDVVWERRFIGEGVIKNVVQELRQALGDNPKAPRFIETVHGRGYRFIADTHSIEHPVPPAGGPEPGESPVVGRAGVLERLHDWLGQSLAGQPRLVFLNGEPGIGKTTLVRHLAASLPADVLILEGHCIEQYGQAEPYLPVLEALNGLGRLDRAALVDCLVEGLAAGDPAAAPLLARIQDDG